jgi:hypothetical protein
MAEVIEEYQD